jgi:hypothetical protein
MAAAWAWLPVASAAASCSPESWRDVAALVVALLAALWTWRRTWRLLSAQPAPAALCAAAAAAEAAAAAAAATGLAGCCKELRRSTLEALVTSGDGKAPPALLPLLPPLLLLLPPPLLLLLLPLLLETKGLASVPRRASARAALRPPACSSPSESRLVALLQSLLSLAAGSRSRAMGEEWLPNMPVRWRAERGVRAGPKRCT